jgi:ElaB/YqjD/DUF883 family membrane-anchored ribosome-binding protein
MIEESTNSTTGVNVDNWSFPVDDSDQQFQVNIWDFGGQEIQYATHQFFLSPRVVYVLLSDGRKQDTPFDYWFNVIQLFGEGSPFLVALNEHEGCHSPHFDHVHYHDLYGDQFPVHQADLNLGDSKPNRFLVLREKIEKLLLKLPHIGTELPANWPPIRRALQDKAGENTISLAQYREICSAHKITSEDDQMVLLRYLNDIGALLHYEDPALVDTVFLNPDWVLDAAYALLQSEKVEKDNGEFSKDWLFELWQRKGYPLEIRGKLLELLLRRRFELVYQLPTGNYVAPQLLTTNKPRDLPQLEVKLRFRFQYPFKPHGILSCLIVRFHDLIHDNKVWRRGVLLASNGTMALVEDTRTKDRGDQIIAIQVAGTGNASKELLDEIRYQLRSIHKSFPGLKVNEEVPVPQNPDVAIPYRFLHERRHAGDRHVTYPGVTGKLHIDTLLEGLEERHYEENGMPKSLEINVNQIVRDVGNPTNTIRARVSSQANANSELHFNFQMEISALKGPVAELADDLEDQGEEETAAELEAIQAKLEKLEDMEGDGAKLKKKAVGPMNKVARFLHELNDEESKTRKAIEKVKSSTKVAQKMADKYNRIAEWCGLPQVPKVFL